MATLYVHACIYITNVPTYLHDSTLQIENWWGKKNELQTHITLQEWWVHQARCWVQKDIVPVTQFDQSCSQGNHWMGQWMILLSHNPQSNKFEPQGCLDKINIIVHLCSTDTPIMEPCRVQHIVNLPCVRVLCTFQCCRAHATQEHNDQTPIEKSSFLKVSRSHFSKKKTNTL